MPKVIEPSTITARQTSPPQSTAPRRIACDRCHGQKLKCPRDVNGGSPCTRCAKAGAICQTSPARATGRPAKNPKQRPRKLESSESINSSRPSLTSASSGSTSSSNSTDDDLNAPGAGLAPVMSHATSSPDDFLATPAMHSLPMVTEPYKYDPSSDMQFPYINVLDDGYTNPLGMLYDDGNLLNFDQTMTQAMPLVGYSQDPMMGMGFTYADTEFGAMPQQHTPPLSIIDDLHDMKPLSDDRRTSNSSSSTRGYHSRHASIDSYHRPSMPQSSFSSPLQHAHTISEEFPTSTLAIRTLSDEDSASKKRRFSSLMSCTPQNELASLGHSQALSSIQLEVDNFSRTVIEQNGSDVDVGVLLPIAERFVTMIPRICQRSSNQDQHKRRSSVTGFKAPSLERSQTEPDATSLENASLDCRSLDPSLIQLIFTCQQRLHFAFEIALNVISVNVSDGTNASYQNHPTSSIGSHNFSSPLSTILHLHAISHSLDRLETTLRKYLSPDSASTAAIFDGVFYNHNQKRNEIASQAYREQAFEEASKRKNLLKSKITAIYAVVGEEC